MDNMNEEKCEVAECGSGLPAGRRVVRRCSTCHIMSEFVYSFIQRDTDTGRYSVRLTLADGENWVVLTGERGVARHNCDAVFYGSINGIPYRIAFCMENGHGWCGVSFDANPDIGLNGLAEDTMASFDLNGMLYRRGFRTLDLLGWVHDSLERKVILSSVSITWRDVQK